VLVGAIQRLQLCVLQRHGKIGVEKRDILVDRVGEARDARETFRSSLERFQSVIDTPNTGLQKKYDTISEAYNKSVNAANACVTALTR